MALDAHRFTLVDLVDVRSGYPFRGSIAPLAAGEALAVQMKDADPDLGVDWPGVTRTTLAGRKHPDWLHADDVLFVSKGARFYAVCIGEPPSPAVCSPHFFLLRVVLQARLLPAFLAWQINQAPFQRQLEQAAEGSSQLSIRRPVLQALALSVPPLADQQRIVALATLARRERRALHQLMHNREQQLRSLAEGLAQSAFAH